MASFTHPQARNTKSHPAGHTRQPALPSASSYAGYRSLGNPLGPLGSDLPSIKHTPICEVFLIVSYGRTMKVASPGRWDFHINQPIQPPDSHPAKGLLSTSGPPIPQTLCNPFCAMDLFNDFLLFIAGAWWLNYVQCGGGWLPHARNLDQWGNHWSAELYYIFRRSLGRLFLVQNWNKI